MSREVEAFTIGVEEEFQIIDPLTYALSADVERIFPRAYEILGNTVQYELILSQVEVATPVCHSLQDVRASLAHLRRTLINAAAQEGKLLAAAGTHPFSPWYEQIITPKGRYRKLASKYQRLIKEQVIFGCHVHVGISDREVALEVMNRARIWLPMLLTLSASSPFWEGMDTQYASFRTGLWWSSPLAGPPPFFSSRSEYDAFVNALVTTKSIEDATRIYWDIRLSDRYKTIEFRVMDVCMTIDETLMIAGLIRALVHTCLEETHRKLPVPEVRAELIRVANWRAARYGLEGDTIDVIEERTAPARDMIKRFLSLLRPALEAEGDWEFISKKVEDILQRGNGAMRQREIFRRTHKVEDVMRYIVDETSRESLFK